MSRWLDGATRWESAYFIMPITARGDHQKRDTYQVDEAEVSKQGLG